MGMEFLRRQNTLKKRYPVNYWAPTDCQKQRIDLNSNLNIMAPPANYESILQQFQPWADLNSLLFPPTMCSPSMHHCISVDTLANLIDVSKRILSNNIISVDAEFDNVDSYLGHIELTQISSVDFCFVIDVRTVCDHIH